MVKLFYMRDFASHNKDDGPKSWGRRANYSDIFDVQSEHEFDIP